MIFEFESHLSVTVIVIPISNATDNDQFENFYRPLLTIGQQLKQKLINFMITNVKI